MASKRPIVQRLVAQLPSGYAALLDDIKARVRAAQLKAGLAVNRELVLLYWYIGREILARQKQEGWGAKVIDRLSRDLAREFPDMKGLSPRNLLFMRAFADEYADETIVKQLVSLLPWGHVVRLVQAVKPPAEREWYARAAVELGRGAPASLSVAVSETASQEPFRRPFMRGNPRRTFARRAPQTANCRRVALRG
jgi:predicted nuclease of restriction endonuclease-like (RecB) superfamily